MLGQLVCELKSMGKQKMSDKCVFVFFAGCFCYSSALIASKLCGEGGSWTQQRIQMNLY